MKVECVREKLEEAIARAEKITSKHLSLPVLQCVLLIAKDSVLTIRATNLDLGLEVRLPVKVEEEGVVALPASTLKNFLTSLYGDKKVFISLEETTCVVETSHSKTNIKTFPYEDFPSIPLIGESSTISLPSEKFLSGLKSVFYSSSISSMKPELSSVYIYTEEDEMVFVATDSFRLAEKRISLKKGVDISPLLIPFKNVSEIVKILDETGDDIEVSLSETQVSFSQNSTYITSRVVDGVFPDYAQIIPKESATEVVVLKKDFIDALRLSNVFTDKFNQITFEVDPEEKKFFIRTHNNDIGETTAYIDAAIQGDDIEMSFNYRYVTDCFQSITTDSISLSLSSGRPMILKGVGDSSFLYLVMPMNK